jgi:hypothetical protein
VLIPFLLRHLDLSLGLDRLDGRDNSGSRAHLGVAGVVGLLDVVGGGGNGCSDVLVVRPTQARGSDGGLLGAGQEEEGNDEDDGVETDELHIGLTWLVVALLVLLLLLAVECVERWSRVEGRTVSEVKGEG